MGDQEGGEGKLGGRGWETRREGGEVALIKMG